MEVSRFIAHLLALFRRSAPILVATVLIGGICLFAEPLYETNDDSFLAMIGGGFGVAVRPDPYLFWTHWPHYFNGLLLVALNRFIGPNVHGWVTVFAIWLSRLLVIQAARQARILHVRIGVPVWYIGAVSLTALLSAEFTITTGVLFGAAIASWLVLVYGDRRINWLRLSVIGVALILSYLVRPEAFIMAVIVVAPALLFLSWRSEVRWSARLLTFSLSCTNGRPRLERKNGLP